jgi:hypothetical protein
MDDLTSRLQRAAAQPTRAPIVDRPYQRAQRFRGLRLAAVAVFVVVTTLTIAIGTVGVGRHTPRVQTNAGASTPSTTDSTSTVASWPAYRDTAHDFVMSIAPGWYRTEKPLEPWLVSPGEILSLATTRLSPTGHHVACASGIPQTVVANIGADGIYLWLGEWHPAASLYGTTPNPRPTHFADVAWTALCQLPNAMTAKEYTFTDSARDFTAHLVFGPDASADRTAQVYKMLDGLHFGT